VSTNKGGTWIIATSGKAHVLFDELNRYRSVIHFPDEPEHVLHISRQPVHGMAYERITWTNVIEAAWRVAAYLYPALSFSIFLL
jgi:hypothetical protein